MEIVFEPISAATIGTYIDVGTQSYCEHYLHLWEKQDPQAYLSISFTKEVVKKEINDPNCLNFLVKSQNESAGILKISKDVRWGDWSEKDALYLHRIYLLKSATGRTIGKAVLDFTEKLARDLQKKIIWLEAMKNGKAKSFYLRNGYTTIGESNILLPGVLEDEKEMWVLAKRI